jgi:hypothetical protein
MHFSIIFIAVLVLSGQNGISSPVDIVIPYESGASASAANEIDTAVTLLLKKQGLQPANLCSDEVFFRRAYLDTTGTLPKAQDVREFLSHKQPTKRAELIDALLESDAFVDYWALKWCDLLRVKAEFPINLWPNAVQAYHHWIHDAIKRNMPYDRFARELLTASGSNFRVPQVNFYRAVQERTPSAITSSVMLTFMGIRLETLSQKQQHEMETFFSRIAFKETAEWKEEIVFLDPSITDSLNVVFLDGNTSKIKPEQDPPGKPVVYPSYRQPSLGLADGPWDYSRTG